MATNNTNSPISAKILIQPDETSAASQKFTRRLNEMLARIPDSKLPRIAVQIDVNRTKSVFQKQLKDIMKSMSLDTSSLYKSGSGSGSKSISVVNDLKLEAKQIRDIERASLNLQKIRDANHAKTIKQQKEVYQEAKKTMRRDTNVGNLYDEFLGYTNKNVNYKKDSYFLKEAQDLRKELSDAFYNGTTEESFNKLQNRVTRFQTQMKEAGLEAETWGQRIRRLFKDHFNTAVAMAGIHLLRQSLQQMIGVVQELDKSLVNIQMVTGGTRTQAAELMKTYNQMGKELGATTAEVSTSANEFLRQGKSIEDTNKLIEQSMILSKVGMLGSAESTQYLTSAMKGYKVSVEDVSKIVDKVSKVDVVSATSTAGLMEGMSRVANFANDVGYSMDKLLATLATIGEVTQRDMSTVGDSLRTLFARMSNIKLGKLIDDESGESLSDVETSLNQVGIKLRENETDFRNYGDVLDEVASRWSEFNDVQKNTIATSFAGSRRIEDFRVLMSNYDNVLKYTTESLNSAGSAQKKFNEAYKGGLESSQKEFTAAFEAVSTNIINSELFKFFIDLGTKLLEIINIGDGILIKITAIIAGLILIPPILKTIGSLTLFTNMQASLAGVLTFLKAIPVAFAIAKAEAAGFAGVLQLLNINPVIASITALIAVTVGAVALFDALTVSEKEAAEAAEAARQKYESTLSELKSINEELKTTQERIDELNEKDKLTFSEKGELQQLKDTNAELRTRLELIEKQKEVEAREVNKTQIEKYQKEFQTEKQKTSSESGRAWYDEFTMRDTEEGYIDYYIGRLNELNKVKEKNGKFTKDQLREFNEVEKYLVNTGVALTDYAKNIVVVDDETKKWKDTWTDLSDKINFALNPDKYKDELFTKIFDEDFSYLKSKFVELSKNGDLEIAIENNKELKDALDQVGLSVSDVVEQFKALSYESDFDILNNGVTDFTSNIDKAKKSVESLKTTMNDFADIMEKAASGQEMSGKEIVNLLTTYPELESAVISTANGYKLEENAVKKVLDAKIKQNKLEIEDSIKAAKKVLEAEGIKLAGINATTDGIKGQIQAKVAQLRMEWAEYGLPGFAFQYSEQAKQIDNLRGLLTTIEKGEVDLKQIDNLMKYFGNTSKYTGSAIVSAAKATNDYNEALKSLEDAQKAILSLQDLVMNKIKKQKDLEKEALKEKLDGFKKEADARKNALRQLKDQHNYEKTVAEKEKSISEIKRQLIALDADDSAWATRRKLELNEQLSEKQTDLDDYLYDQNIQRQEEQIDAWYEKQKNSIDNQLKNIEHYLENQELLMSDSMKAINGMSDKLYKDLVAYNKSYGDGIESTVKKAWEDAEKALESYGTKANAIKTFDSIEKQIIKNAEGKPIDSKPSSGSSSSGSTTTPKTPKKGEVVTVEKSASKWATGQSIASFVKGGKYEVIQVNKDGTTVIGRNGVVTGKIKNTDLVGYKTGGVNTTTGLHMLHGSNANSEVVFNSTDAKKLFNLVNNTDNLSKLLAEKLSLKVPAVTAGNGGFNYNVDITIQGNANDDTIKKLEDTSRKLFGEFKSQFNKDLRSRGFGTAIKI